MKLNNLPKWRLAEVVDLGIKTRPPVSKPGFLTTSQYCLLRLKISWMWGSGHYDKFQVNYSGSRSILTYFSNYLDFYFFVFICDKVLPSLIYKMFIYIGANSSTFLSRKTDQSSIGSSEKLTMGCKHRRQGQCSFCSSQY